MVSAERKPPEERRDEPDDAHDALGGDATREMRGASSELPRKLARAEVELLLERHMPQLRTYVRLRAGPLLRAREPLSDLVQSALREAYEEMEDFEYTSDGAFRAFLYTVATNKIISKNRYHTAQRRAGEREQP